MSYKEKYLKYKKKYLKLQELKKSLLNKQTGGGNEDLSQKEVYLFKAEWCPHCQTFKKTWGELSEKFSNKYKFITYDSDKNKNEIKEWLVKGFPTIILKDGEKAIEYVGPRDIESLSDFINKKH
jgi:thiol-disulfide isomerase/thioredoxin